MVAIAKGLIAAVGCVGLLASGPAVAASSAAASTNYSPWASLSAFASPVSSQALCGAAAASAATQAAPGCVLPAVDPAPVPVVQETPVAVPVAASGGGGIGVLPLLLGLAALAGLAALLLGNNDDDDDDIVARPISPA